MINYQKDLKKIEEKPASLRQELIQICDKGISDLVKEIGIEVEDKEYIISFLRTSRNKDDINCSSINEFKSSSLLSGINKRSK